MKTLIKLSLIFLCIVIPILILGDTYILFVSYKLSVAAGLDFISVVSKYNVLHNVGICAFFMLLTIIILVIIFGFIIDKFLNKRNKIMCNKFA
jgi:uncharacterized membrane protein